MTSARQPCRSVVFLVVVISLITAMTAAHATVIYDQKIDTFDIGVRSGDAQTVWAGISRWGPSANGGHALGTTTGRVKWSFKSVPSSRGCTIRDVKVMVQADIMLPGWPYRTRADTKTQTFWGCIEKTVSVHEQRHAEIWRETAHAIDDALRGLSDPMRCDGVESAVNTIANRIYDEGRTRQTEFDAAEYKIARERTCFDALAIANGETKPKPTDIETAEADQPRAEQFPYPMPPPAKRDRDDDVQSHSLFDPNTLPTGALIGAAGILALFGLTYLVVSSGQMASRKVRDAEVEKFEASLADAQASRDRAKAERRIQADRRAAPRGDGENPGRRAADFGRRAS